MKTQLPYEQMMTIAAGLVSRFAPNCDRLEVAGSLRRKKDVIGDVELIAVPTPALYEQLDGLLDAGKIRHVEKKRWGNKLRSFVFDSAKGHAIQVDIFLQPDPATWGVNFMIRTGSSDFSHRMVTVRKQGGWMPDMYRIHEARVWLGVDVVSTPQETDVFRLWGMDYVPATLRTADYKLAKVKPPTSPQPTDLIVQVDTPMAGRFTFADAERLTAESATWPLPTFEGGPGKAAQRAIEASERERMRVQGVKG